MAGLSDEVRAYMEDFILRYTMQDVRNYAEKASRLKVLVIGDVIIDKYTYCQVQGTMSKDMGYSMRLSYSEEYLGGSIAVARHLASFTKQLTLMSIIGNEDDWKTRIREELEGKIQVELEYSQNIPTIVKHRYLTKNAKREEYRKILAIHNMPENVQYEQEVYDRFKTKVSEKIAEYDVVFVCDFGHGLIDREVIDIIQKKAKYLVLNCQTNSTNKGLNIITKYTRADAFTLDQVELKLAFPEFASDEKSGLQKLSEYLKGNGWLTRGSLGAYDISRKVIHECPAFTLSVKDTIGAGDAFFAAAGIMTAAGAPTELGTFVGNIAGALGANIIGNKEPVEKVNILKFASTLMNV